MGFVGRVCMYEASMHAVIDWVLSQDIINPIRDLPPRVPEILEGFLTYSGSYTANKI